MDPIAAWQDTYERVAELVTALPNDALARRVPACPDWTVTDLLSHVIGVDADTLSGDEADDHNPGWTQSHVDQRRGRAVEELLAEWSDLAEPLCSWMVANNARPLGDLVIHEQDLRSGIGVPGGRDSVGVKIIRDQIAGRFGQAVADLPPVELRGPGWSWASGDQPETVLEADDFDLFRALTSRRTAEQLRSWTTQGDVTAYLEAFGALGPLPTQALPE